MTIGAWVWVERGRGPIARGNHLRSIDGHDLGAGDRDGAGRQDLVLRVLSNHGPADDDERGRTAGGLRGGQRGDRERGDRHSRAHSLV
jgi:hypothetical protein